LAKSTFQILRNDIRKGETKNTFHFKKEFGKKKKNTIIFSEEKISANIKTEFKNIGL